MFVTIWMCTQEWSLICIRATAFTFATCHQPFSWSSRFTRSITRRSFSFAATGTLIRIRATASVGREADLALGLGRDRIGIDSSISASISASIELLVALHRRSIRPHRSGRPPGDVS